MLVKQILSGKETTGVESITEDLKVSQAVEMLSAKRIGALVVSAGGETVDGILSERDIVRELGQRGPDCLNQTVGQMMTRDIVTCAPEDKTDDVLEKMTAGRFRHMPVMTDGKMVGIISIGDVVKARLSELQTERDALEGMIAGF